MKQYEKIFGCAWFRNSDYPTVDSVEGYPNSSSCLDHMIISSFFVTNTIPTIICDHYTVTADILLKGCPKMPQKTTAITKYRNLGEYKGERAWNVSWVERPSEWVTNQTKKTITERGNFSKIGWRSRRDFFFSL